jgi:hypothetical protein
MAGDLPVVTMMRLGAGDSTSDVPLERISTVGYRQSKGRMIAGVVIMATFVAVIVIVKSNQPKPRPRTLDCGSSTPYYQRYAAVLREVSARP